MAAGSESTLQLHGEIEPRSPGGEKSTGGKSMGKSMENGDLYGDFLGKSMGHSHITVENMVISWEKSIWKC